MAFWIGPQGYTYGPPSGAYGGNPLDGYEDLFVRPRRARRGPRPGAYMMPEDREAAQRKALSREALRAKRRAQAELSVAREALAGALDVGNAAAAAKAAEELATKKNDLLELSRSNSTARMVEEAEGALAAVPSPEEIPGCAKVRAIMESAKPVTEGVEPFIERAERLKAELESLQKEYLRLDSHISKAQIALDGVETVSTEGTNTARAMRRKANDHLTECLEAIDEAAEPLRQAFQQDLFKSSQYF